MLYGVHWEFFFKNLNVIHKRLNNIVEMNSPCMIYKINLISHYLCHMVSYYFTFIWWHSAIFLKSKNLTIKTICSIYQSNITSFFFSFELPIWNSEPMILKWNIPNTFTHILMRCKDCYWIFTYGNGIDDKINMFFVIIS